MEALLCYQLTLLTKVLLILAIKFSSKACLLDTKTCVNITRLISNRGISAKEPITPEKLIKVLIDIQSNYELVVNFLYIPN